MRRRRRGRAEKTNATGALAHRGMRKVSQRRSPGAPCSLLLQALGEGQREPHRESFRRHWPVLCYCCCLQCMNMLSQVALHGPRAVRRTTGTCAHVQKKDAPAYAKRNGRRLAQVAACAEKQGLR